MVRPMLPETETVDGDETVIIRKGPRPYRAMLSRIINALAPKPPRIQHINVTTAANGTRAVTFDPPFINVPTVIPLTGWGANQQMIVPSVSNLTRTGCTLTAMRSRGTLLLTSGPFEPGGSHPVSIVAIGN